jgi:hypothetical protein
MAHIIQCLQIYSPHPSVIIGDFNVMGVMAAPYKANPELIVDPDTVLPLPVAPEFL